jgi:hypothetical protein
MPMLFATIGGAILGKLTTTTLLVMGSLVVIWYMYKEFLWKQVRP